jgi:microcompartment protein CcmK/EutM
MILCRVIGNAVATVKHPCFEGKSVLVCQPVGMDGRTPKGKSFLSVDSVQAGQGDLVLVAREGNCARQILGRDEDPLHSVILGVVDGDAAKAAYAGYPESDLGVRSSFPSFPETKARITWRSGRSPCRSTSGARASLMARTTRPTTPPSSTPASSPG